MKRYTRLLLCFSLFYALIFCLPVSADDSQTVRVGIYENSPKIFTDENGNAAGFWPDIIAYIASEEGWEIEYVHGTWAESLDRLENNEIDIMPDVAYTEERAELYAFSNEIVYESWSTVYTREGVDIESILDLEGKTIAVLQGSVNVEGPEGIKTLVSAFDIDCTFIEVDSYTRVFELVASGEADAGVTSKDFGHLYEAEFNLAKTAIIFQPSSLYFAFPKDSSLTPYLIERIDSRVEELKADEESIYYQALENWFGIKPAGKAVIPGWMKWALIGVGGLALLLVGGGLLLRSQVKARTKELREEVIQRQKAEERERHINLVLQALRGINQLITRERDRDRMIQKGCKILVDTRGYERAWIALVDENKRPLSVVAAGLGKESPVFLKQMKSGEYPECVKELRSQDSPFLGLDRPGAQHKGCILAESHSHRGVYRCRLEYDGKVYGMLGVTVPSEMFADKTEKDLFLELGGDISYALAALERQDAHQRAEEALENSEKFLDSVIENAPNAIWVSDEKGTIIRMNQALRNLLKIKDEEIIGKYNVLNDSQVIEQGFLPLVKSVFEKGETVGFTLNYDTAKEKQVEAAETVRRVLEIVISAVKNEDGKVTHAICQERDITGRKRMEAALRESEARYRAVIEGAHDMIQSVDLDGRIILVNQFWLDTLGYTEAELSELKLFDIIHPDSLAHCRAMFAEVIGGKSVHGIEAAFLTKDGRQIFVEGNAAPRYIGDKVVATQGIFRDVTERKRMEEELQAERNKLQSIISAVEYGINIQDRDYKILYQSRPSPLDGGYHLGENCYRANEGRDEVCDDCPMAKAFKDGKPHTAERRVVSSSGEVLFLEITAIPMKDDEGKIVSCLEVSRDITERKQTEEELRLRAQLLDSATDSIFVHDLDENFVYVNEATCRLYGYSREELLKMKLHQLVPPEQANGLATLKQETLGKGEMVFETVNLRKDGSVVPLEVHSRTIESGGEKFILAIARDITERKKMEETLVITDRLASVGELASGIAHELNNPLTGVIGFAQLVLDKPIPDDIREDVDMVYREAQRAAQVVKNLLTFARKHPPEKQMLNINVIIEKVLELRAYEQRVNNVRVDKRLSPDLPDVMADYFQLQQVFLNIIINAEYFMKEAHNGGTLTIITEKAGNNVRASFADDGSGIDAKNLGHLFDPFFTTKEVGKGTGLGLSICHGIVAEHGGRIYAESKLGKGATFIVELPIGRRQAEGGKNEKRKRK
jgi:PAS domain S-box-containing protein